MRTRTTFHSGFTLVELLIVISIIAILSSLIITGLGVATEARNKTEAVSTIASFKTSIANYKTDTAKLPAQFLKPDPERNDFPKLWAALMHEPPVGGPSAPYIDDYQREKIAVYDEDLEEYVRAGKDELDDPSIEKFMLDPWGEPYIYRANKGLPKEDYMLRPGSYDLYSKGPNGEDDTIVGTEGDDNDDVTNN